MTDLEPKRIVLSDEAKAAALRLQAEDSNYSGKVLRLYLDGKGCDGFYYGVCFDKAMERDLSFAQEGSLDVLVDPETFEYVQGATINWVDDERGRGFLVDNPAHRQFRGKFFKRSAWQSAHKIEK